jgi:hypothetical protein
MPAHSDSILFQRSGSSRMLGWAGSTGTHSGAFPTSSRSSSTVWPWSSQSLTSNPLGRAAKVEHLDADSAVLPGCRRYRLRVLTAAGIVVRDDGDPLAGERCRQLVAPELGTLR